jgi:hypothetical protein
MTVMVELEPALADRVRETAARKGQSAGEYLRELAEHAVPPPQPPLSQEEWLALLHRVPPVKPHPEIPAEALRRENMYEDRL